MRVIVDIETVGSDFDSLDDMTQEYLMKFAETDEEKEEVRQSLSFYPVTGEVVTIGMLNPDSGKGAVYFQAPGESLDPFEEDNIKFTSDNTEEGILKKFWEVIQSYEQMVTFNGRGFDAPFLIIRSAVHHIAPTTVLMPNRYDRKHLDLLDQLIFYGSVRRRFSLHMYCNAFGIKSPKDEGITGHEIAELYKNKGYLDIARYCARDLYATRDLFFYWDKYIRGASS